MKHLLVTTAQLTLGLMLVTTVLAAREVRADSPVQVAPLKSEEKADQETGVIVYDCGNGNVVTDPADCHNSNMAM